MLLILLISMSKKDRYQKLIYSLKFLSISIRIFWTGPFLMISFSILKRNIILFRKRIRILFWPWIFLKEISKSRKSKVRILKCLLKIAMILMTRNYKLLMKLSQWIMLRILLGKKKKSLLKENLFIFLIIYRKRVRIDNYHKRSMLL